MDYVTGACPKCWRLESNLLRQSGPAPGVPRAGADILASVRISTSAESRNKTDAGSLTSTCKALEHGTFDGYPGCCQGHDNLIIFTSVILLTNEVRLVMI